MSDTCNLCKFHFADAHAHDTKLRCANQKSPNFGEETNKGCEHYSEFVIKPDMPFKDALETVIMLPEGAYPSFYFKFNRKDEVERPFIFISFNDNEQMIEWRAAHERCFVELMRLKEEAGDFDEEETE